MGNNTIEVVAPFHYEIGEETISHGVICNNEQDAENAARHEVELGIFNEVDACFYYKSYHNSWDWLMPVVEKIKTLKMNVEINTYENECVIYGRELIGENTISIGMPEDELIDSTYKAVVEFITWYNENKK